jgi:hypothetical protein
LLGYYLSFSEEGTSVLKAEDFLTADRAFSLLQQAVNFQYGGRVFPFTSSKYVTKQDYYKVIWKQNQRYR